MRLLIGTVFCLLAVWTIAFVLTATTKFHDDSIIRYHLFLQRLEGDDFLFTIKKFSATEIELHSIVTDKNYKLTKYCNYVRITGIKKGHIPVLKNVKNIEWQQKKLIKFKLKENFKMTKSLVQRLFSKNHKFRNGSLTAVAIIFVAMLTVILLLEVNQYSAHIQTINQIINKYQYVQH